MTTSATGSDLRARNAVASAFILNGLVFATLFSRVPDLRERLDLSNGQLGLLLLSISVGSLLGLPASGRMIERFGAPAVCRGGGVLVALGMGIIALGVSGLEVEAVVAAGLGCYGFGTAVWDVAMNVEGAEVERRLGRTVMPRFHAAWSFGSIGGAGIGVLAARFAVPLPVHFLVVSAAALAGLLVAVRAFLPAVEHHEHDDASARAFRVARAPHAGHRRDGAGLHAGGGIGQRLAGAGPGRRLRRPSPSSASQVSPSSWSR